MIVSSIASSASRRARGTPPATLNTAKFPISIHTSNRYFVDAAGKPFLFYGYADWMAPNQLSNAQIDTLVNGRAAQGCTVILVEAPGFYFTSQSPATNNVDGAAPFTTMSPHYNWVLNDNYWNRVDYLVDACKAKGIFVIINPAYMGFGGGQEGCLDEITAASAGTLQTCGAALANRFTQGNVGLCAGGDHKADATGRAKQWNIVTGFRSVNPNVLVMAHPARGEDAYSIWGPGGDNLTGWNVGTVYCAKDGTDAATLTATAYGRSIVCILMEDGYEGEATLAEFRRSKYAARLGGAAGFIGGNNPMWGLGEGHLCGGGGAAAALASDLNSAGAQQLTFMRALFDAYPSHILVPKTDTSLVALPNPLGTGTSRVVPALASNGSFAMIFTPSVNLTVVRGSLTRFRWFDCTTGAYTAASGTDNGNGTTSFTAPGERVLVGDIA